MNNCPCNAKCPNGCPCPNYECPITTTTMPTTTTALGKPNDSVLILNTARAANPPIMTNLDGREHTNFWFKFENGTQAHGSCAMLFYGQFYIFGGFDNKQQISTLAECSVKRLGSLPFVFEKGACTSAQQRIYLCFEDSSDYQTCRVADNPLGPFQEIDKSIFRHNGIQIVSNEGDVYS